mmetsp:Transcript_50194/g.108029  ORF Transcript_50194/g.108029 Transcript_50194/m.108029 type:complete len:351 (+) Transcript_50194:55-1107(+)
MSIPSAALVDALATSSSLPCGSLQIPHKLPKVRAIPTLLGEVAVVLSSLLVIGSIPGYPILLCVLFYRAWKCDGSPQERRRCWGWFLLALAGYVLLATVPVAVRPALMQTRFWRWWLEYMSVRVAYRDGKALPPGQYLFLMMPHGLYPFSGACASLSEMVPVFMNMQIAVAPVGQKVPMIRQLMGWIGCISASSRSISKALANGRSVGLFPGGIGEMVQTDANMEKIILLKRKGFVREAIKNSVPIVPVYVFGQSITFGQLPLPAWVQELSRRLRASIIFPFGRFGMLVPRKLPLLYAIGAPILGRASTPGSPSTDEIEQVHSDVVSAVRDLYDFYKGFYGWDTRSLCME